MMNRALLQRQMFANGGRVIPDDAKGLQALASERPDVVKKMGFKPMQEGGLAGLMQQQDMAAMPMGSPPMDQPPMAAQGGVDPNILASTLSNVAEDTGDLEQAPDFQSMMNQFSGEDKSEEERRDDLASIVGPEDAAQTPDSVLALVTPVVQISMAEEGIAPMAREAMDTPVQGDMAGGIMSMTGAGNEPPENFRYGGEVRRRGDEDPVLKFSNGAGVPSVGGFSRIPTTEDRLNNLLLQNMALAQNQKKLEALSALPKVKPARDLKTIFEEKKDLYGSLLGDSEEQKRLTQAQMLFDIANTALTFAAPMPGEKPGMSAAERLAMAATTTKLAPTIGARAAQLSADKRKLDLAALQAAETTQAAEKKSALELQKKLIDRKSKTITVGENQKVIDIDGNVLASGPSKKRVLRPGDSLYDNDNNLLLTVPPKPKYNVVKGELVKTTEDSEGNVKSVSIFGTRTQEKPNLHRIIYPAGTTEIVDVNSESGLNAVKNTPSGADVVKIAAAKTPDPTPILLTGSNKVVMSYDGGKSYTDDSGQKVNIAPGSGFAISADKSYDVYKSEKVRADAKKALSNMKSKNYEVFSQGVPAELKKDFDEVQKMVLNGTGFYSNVRAGLMVIDGFLPDAVQLKDFFGSGTDTVQARQYLKTVVALGRSALVKNNKFPVKEMEFMKELFIDPDTFFNDPQQEIKRIKTLRDTLIAQKAFNLSKLASGDTGDKENDLITNNSEIDRLVFLLGGFDVTSGGGSSNVNRGQILKNIIKPVN